MSEHTKEPWSCAPAGPVMRDQYAQPSAIWDPSNSTLIAGTFGDGPGELKASRANAVRIVACVNACAGIADPEAALDAARSALIAVQDEVSISSGVEDMVRRAIALLGKGAP